MKEQLNKQLLDQKIQYEGQLLKYWTIFDHPEYELKSRLPALQSERYIEQENILTNEFNSLKIQPSVKVQNSRPSTPMSSREIEALKLVHDSIKDLKRP